MKMVDAGWHYCPTVESDDYARCAYCSLSLDGWEPKDDPQYVSELTSCVHNLTVIVMNINAGRPTACSSPLL